jgi:hypothetical protein
MAEPIFTKLGMYIMAPELISTAYFINPFHQTLWLNVYPFSLLGNDSVKLHVIFVGNGSVKT